jgi:hypothetical protein
MSERYNRKRRREAGPEHLEQFTLQAAPTLSVQTLGLTRPYRRLIAIRSIGNLYLLDKVLEDTNTETTDVIAMHAQVLPPASGYPEQPRLSIYDQRLMTAVVERAEKEGKAVKPLVVTTNNSLHAILNAAKTLEVQEVILAAVKTFRVPKLIRRAIKQTSAGTRLEKVAAYWLTLHGGRPAPLTVHLLSREKDTRFDLSSGSPVPDPAN